MDEENKIVIDATGKLKDILVIKFDRIGGWNNHYEIPLKDLIDSHFSFRDLEINYNCLLSEVRTFENTLKKVESCFNKTGKNNE